MLSIMVSYSRKNIHSQEYIFVEFLKFLGDYGDILSNLDGLLPGRYIVHFFGIFWKVLNLVAYYCPLHFFDSGKYQGMM